MDSTNRGLLLISLSASTPSTQKEEVVLGVIGEADITTLRLCPPHQLSALGGETPCPWPHFPSLSSQVSVPSQSLSTSPVLPDVDDVTASLNCYKVV